jgi:ABC-type uncharacterized transport system fused permease/ATPase subunit
MKLPATTVVSIGDRSTLAAFHTRRIELRRSGDSGPAFLADETAMAEAS